MQVSLNCLYTWFGVMFSGASLQFHPVFPLPGLASAGTTLEVRNKVNHEDPMPDSRRHGIHGHTEV